jgi:superfamily II DNA/RNA helicase
MKNNNTFSQLGLSEKLSGHIETFGFKNPTPIQEQTIPHVLMNRDICASAETGTGKTGAFLLPIIDVLMHNRKRSNLPTTVILEPTRELAMQVYETFQKITAGYCKLKAALLVGGEWLNEQEKQLKKSPDVIIATPGRLLDIYERGRFLANNISIFVIDEADRMLDMGFMPDVEKMLTIFNNRQQTLLFSATFPSELKEIIESILSNPKHIEVTKTSKPAATIQQYKVMVCEEDEKRPALRALLRKYSSTTSAIVFCNRKKDVDIVAKSLKNHGFKGIALHGDLTQHHRNQTLEQFKNSKGHILVASDVAARGLDIIEMPLVINFDLPINAEDYVHRIGRTGRAGHQGEAFSIVTNKDSRRLKQIQDFIGSEVQEYQIVIDEINVRDVFKNKKTLGFGERIPHFMLYDPQLNYFSNATKAA